MGERKTGQYAMHYAQHFRRQDRREAFFLLLNAYLQVAAPAVGAVIYNFMLASPGKPCPRFIPCSKHRDAGGADSCRQMHRAAVMSDENFRPRKNSRRLTGKKFSA